MGTCGGQLALVSATSTVADGAAGGWICECDCRELKGCVNIVVRGWLGPRVYCIRYEGCTRASYKYIYVYFSTST
jgi:hypothetical protein